jgi:hypothetical protein
MEKTSKLREWLNSERELVQGKLFLAGSRYWWICYDRSPVKKGQ